MLHFICTFDELIFGDVMQLCICMKSYHGFNYYQKHHDFSRMLVRTTQLEIFAYWGCFRWIGNLQDLMETWIKLESPANGPGIELETLLLWSPSLPQHKAPGQGFNMNHFHNFRTFFCPWEKSKISEISQTGHWTLPSGHPWLQWNDTYKRVEDGNFSSCQKGWH